MTFSLICAIIQISLWWIYKYDIAENFFTKLISKEAGHLINKLIKCLIDILPCILIIKFNTPLALFFLLGCLISDKIISTSTPIGAILFLIVYTITAIFTIKNYPINYIYYIISYASMLILSIILLPLWNENILLKVASIIYAFSALALCLCSFLYTKNIGFLGLIIGDLLLTVREIIKEKNPKYEKLIHSISNSFYFIGLCFVPLSLI